MEPYIVLKFATDMNREYSYRVNRAKTTVTLNEARGIMTGLATLSPFETGRGNVTTPISATLVQNVVKNFEI